MVSKHRTKYLWIW